MDLGGERTTYRDPFAHASRLAHCLTEAGLERGDRVAAWMDDGSAYVELYLAAALTGLTVVPLNARYAVHEVRALLEDSGPRAIAWAEVTAHGAVVFDAVATSDDLLVIGYTSGTTSRPKGALLTTGPCTR